MNYFELFGIPPTLQVNLAALKPVFFQLQKKYHPDYNTSGTEDESNEAMNFSAMVNQAWKTFQKQDDTIKYVLEQKGILQPEEKYALPPDFLMEVLELNELKMDGADGDLLKQKTNALLHQITAPVLPIIAAYDDEHITPAQLQALKAWYYQKKYLDRLLAE